MSVSPPEWRSDLFRANFRPVQVAFRPFTLWLRPLHTAEKHRPTMFHTATVKPTRSGPSILYNTPFNVQ